MMTSLRQIPSYLTLAGLAAATLFAPAAHAASISFTEQLNGPILVTHDNNDWTSFTYTSTANTATVDATLFKFANQGSAGNGTEVIFLKDSLGQITNLLKATVQVTSSSSYSVHYEFFTDAALPAIIPHSTGAYTDVISQGPSTYVGLQTFSHAIGIKTAPIPEPGSAALMLLGLGGIGLVARRKG